MSSRRSSFSGSFVDNVSDRTSNASAYQLATSLALLPSQSSSARASHQNKHGILSKLKHVRIGSHGKRDSASLEWRCKGEDMENFEWPPAEWSGSPMETEPEPELEPSARHVARASSGSTASSASVQTWPDEDYVVPAEGPAVPSAVKAAVGQAQQRQADEQAAIDALETFFARRSISHTYAAASVSDEADLGIDLSVYEDIPEDRPTTFIEAPATPILQKPKVVQPRASFLSFESTSDSSSLAVDFPVEVLDHHGKRTSRTSPVPHLAKLNVDPSRLASAAATSTQSAPAWVTGPLPALPSPQRRRPSSILILGSVVDPISTPYSPKEIRDLARRRDSSYGWI